MEMQYRRLGKSGLKLSLLSYGSWLTFGKQIGDTASEELMKYAYDNGINFFDNAEIYSRGESERVMGRILNKMQWSRDSYTVSSKVFFGDGGKLPTQVGLNRKHVTEACNAALKRLQVEYLDLYFCHRPDKETPIEETVWTMHNLIQQGKILYWGTSEWSAQEITEAHLVAQKNNLIAPVMEQPQYNMFHRQKFEVEYAQLYSNFGMGTTIWSPLASGLLTGKYNNGNPTDTRLNIEGMDWLRERTITEERIEKVKQIQKIAAELGMSTTQLALAWCAYNPNVSTIILGASKIEQLKENLESLNHLGKLNPEIMQKIEAVLQNAPVKPEF
jgi:voltage-dependent potassium channel beta subunit